MKFKSPAFQFYPADWLGSQRVSLMTLEEEGAYIRLLSYCWQHGSIPADPDAAARLIGKGATPVLASKVLTMFQPPLQPDLSIGSPCGAVLVHERLQAEKEKQIAWKTKSSEGGKKSAEKRKKQQVSKKSAQPPLQGSLENGIDQKATLCLQSMFIDSCSSDEEQQAVSKETATADESAATPAVIETEVVEVKPKTKSKECDEIFIAELSRHYPETDVEAELHKMDAWLLLNPGRKKTRRFVVGWLNRIQPELPAEPVKPEPTEKNEYDFRW